MNILLVNDDGYDALGIQIMKKLLSKYGPRPARSTSLNTTRPSRHCVRPTIVLAASSASKPAPSRSKSLPSCDE